MKARLIQVAGMTLVMAACALRLQSAPAETRLTPENRLEIVRLLAYEYATTVQPLPASRKEKEALEVNAEGRINENKLRQTLANRGVAAETGMIVQVTNIEIRDKAILFEINGGGERKKKWYERITVQAGGGVIQPGSGKQPPPPGEGDLISTVGSWILLNFSRPVPNLNADEIKQLLGGVLDFNRQSATVPWIETIPEEFRKAIEEKRAVVGMDKKMVIAALGRPDRKVREAKDGLEYEDWIYGNPPFVTFVTFRDDQVVEVKEFN